MIHQSLPGIKFVGIVKCELLQREIGLKALAGMSVGIFTDVVAVNFVGVPTVECQSDYDNNGRIEQVTLRFLTTNALPSLRKVAFIVTDCNGASYVIGQREPPFPIVKLSRTTGSPSGDPSATTVEVTLYAHKALVPCSLG